MANSEASDLIEMALQQVLAQAPDYQEGDILGEWVLIAYVGNPDEEKGHGVTRFVSNGTIPPHRLRGLLTTALKEMDDEDVFNLLTGIITRRDEDDD